MAQGPHHQAVASCAASVKLWNLNETAANGSGPALTAEFNPHTDNIHAVTWNHTAKVLATASNDGRAALSLPNGQLLCKLPATAPAPEDQERLMALGFGGNSRYLVTGGTAQLVKIWDLKAQVLAKTLTGHTATVTAVTFNKDSTMVASGSLSGEVLLHNLLTALPKASAPLKSTDGQAINAIQYSPFNKTQLAGVTAGGYGNFDMSLDHFLRSLSIWDTETQTLRVSFEQAHTGPAVAVCYSPFNHLLMCTAGKDGKINFYDIEEQRVIKSIDCGATKPLTALSFMNDGVTVAVGTVDGDIMVYDLRVGDSPTRVIRAAHGDAVKCIAFQQKASSSRKRSASTALAVAAGATAAEAYAKPASSTLKKAVINAANAAATVPVVHTTPPHRATASDIPSATSTPMQTNSPRVPLSEQPGATRPPYNVDGGPSHDISPRRLNGAPVPQRVPPSPDYDQGAYISEVKSAAPSTFQPTGIAMPTMGPIGGSAGGPEPTLQERIKMRQSQVPSVHQRHHTNSRATRPPSPIRVQGRMPNHQPAPPAMAAEAMPDNAFSAYQTEFMKSMIEDSLAGFRNMMHRDIHNMHIDMIRQFQIQKNEMEAMLSSASVNAELCNEIERLRHENEILKQRF